MSRRDREERTERTRKVADFDRRVNEHSTDRPSLIMPEGIRLWNPKNDGQYDVAIVPYELSPDSKKFAKNYCDVGELYPERTYWTHANIGVNNDSVVCPAKTFNKDCPICEYRKQVATKPDEASKKLSKELAPKERQLFLIWDMNDQRKGLQLWEISFHLFGKQMEAKLGRLRPDDRAKFKFYFDPDKGYDLVLGAAKKTMGQGNPFLEFQVDEFRSRDPLPDKIVDHGINLDKVPNEMTYEELKKIFAQEEPEDAPPVRGRDDDAPRGRAREDDPPRRSRDTDDPPPRRSRDADDDAPRGRTREPEPSANGTAKFRVKDEVDFTYRNKAYTGVIVALDDAKEMAEIQVDGEDRTRNIDYDMMKPAAKPTPAKDPRDTDDDAPRRRARDEDDRPPARGRDADDAPRRSREPDPEPAPAPRGRTRDDWDDEPVKPRRRDEPDPEPAPRSRR